MKVDTIFLLGYLTDDNEAATRPVVGIPFLSESLHISKQLDRSSLHFEIEKRLGLLTEKTKKNEDGTNTVEHISAGSTIIYECQTQNLPKKSKGIPKKFSLVVVKPGMREQVRESLKGGIVWVSTGGLLKYLNELPGRRARLYRTFILSAGHASLEEFAKILCTSKVGT